MARVLVVGAGKWAQECWAPMLAEHEAGLAVSAVVEPDPGRANSFARRVGISPSACYPSIEAALAAHDEIIAGLVLTPPDLHPSCILQLIEADLHVLTEKPLAIEPRGLGAVLAAVRRTGVKAAVIQNYRYTQRIQMARATLLSGELGDLSHLVVRLAVDYREPGSWDVGSAHNSADPLLVEAAIHHLDMLRYLGQCEIVDVTAVTMNPTGSSFAGDCVGGAIVRLSNGGFGIYEASLLAGGHESGWHREHVRAECTNGSVTCDGSSVTVFRDHQAHSEHVPPADVREGHRYQLRRFADWLDGGPAVETEVEDNARSVAAVLAAMSSAHEQRTVAVAEVMAGLAP